MLSKKELLKLSLEYCDKSQCEQIKLGIKYNIPIEKILWYANPKYSSAQMEQLRLGIQQNLDISKFNDAELSAEKMESIRVSLLPKQYDMGER